MLCYFVCCFINFVLQLRQRVKSLIAENEQLQTEKETIAEHVQQVSIACDTSCLDMSCYKAECAHTHTKQLFINMRSVCYTQLIEDTKQDFKMLYYAY